MSTEITDMTNAPMLQGWVLYDGSCAFCTGLLAHARSTLEASGFRPEPLQSPAVRASLNMPEEVLLAEMRVLTTDGRLMGGADALVYLSRKLRVRLRPWWVWLLVVASRIPLAMPVLRLAYARIAERRYCRQGYCPVERPQGAGKEGIQ